MRLFFFLAFALALAPLAAGAQAAPVLVPTAAAKPRIFAPGPTFISVGFGVAESISTEFGGPPSDAFEGWESGETVLFGRWTVLSTTAYRQFSYQHPAGGVATIGAAGTAAVPAFQVRGSELESTGGVGIFPHVYAVGATLRTTANTGYPPIDGLGYGLALAPAADHGVMPYGNIVYFPNVGGNYALPGGTSTALSYRGLRYQAGVLTGLLTNRIFFDLGFTSTLMRNRTNAPAPIRSNEFTLGFAYRIP